MYKLLWILWHPLAFRLFQAESTTRHPEKCLNGITWSITNWLLQDHNKKTTSWSQLSTKSYQISWIHNISIHLYIVFHCLSSVQRYRNTFLEMSPSPREIVPSCCGRPKIQSCRCLCSSWGPQNRRLRQGTKRHWSWRHQKFLKLTTSYNWNTLGVNISS